MIEDSNEIGIYFATYTIPSSEYRWELRIRVQKDNYVLLGGYQSISLTSYQDPLWIWNEYGLPAVYIVGIGVIAFAGQRVYSRRKRKRTLEALAVKRRFDDLRNLIGIIVLHQTSGLPIYSKMLATGFDSSMISAFITAIRSFRSEIETETAEQEFDLIPISDIVRVVSTRSLLCAFITVTPPTPTQSEKMIEFAKCIGFQFDDLFDAIPAEVIDEETLIQFDYHFDSLMDGNLLKKFRMAESGKFPRGLKCVEKKFEHLELTDGFDLDELALGIASCGIEEAQAYKIVMYFIEKGVIIPLNPEEERILDLGWEMETEDSPDIQSDDDSDDFMPLEG